MSIDYARAIQTAIKQSIDNLKKWIYETKEMGSIYSFISAIYAQLYLVLFLAGAGKQVLMPYLSTVIPETKMNYNKHTMDQSDCELDNKNDDKDNSENENRSMSLDWKKNCFFGSTSYASTAYYLYC